MDYTKLKITFDAFLKESGKSVDELKKKDKPYAYLHNLKLYDANGVSLTMQQRFALVGYERAPKSENPLVKAKRYVDEFIAQGHTVDELTSNDRALSYLKNSVIYTVDGKPMTLEEKFAAIGHPRQPKKTTDVIGKIRQMLIAFEERTGKSASMLERTDPEYKYIWGTIVSGADGHMLTMQEKIAAAGFERAQRHSTDLRQDLLNDIEEYRANGGSFHVVRKNLPFYNRVHNYRDSLMRTTGVDYSFEEIMKNLGYRDYSDIYFRFMELEKISQYRDEDGFVDSYRDDAKLSDFVYAASTTLKLPIALVIELVCEEKLKEVCVSADYFSLLRNEILKYVEINGSLDGVTTKAPTLKNRIMHMKRYMASAYGEEISYEDLFTLLDLEGVGNNLYSSGKVGKDVDAVMHYLETIADKKDGKLNFKDIPKDCYRSLIFKAARLGVTTKAFFKLYDIDYVDGKDSTRLGKYYTSKYPYIDEMLERKHQIVKASGISAENGNCKEEIFEESILASIQAYADFEKKISKEEDRMFVGGKSRTEI